MSHAVLVDMFEARRGINQSGFRVGIHGESQLNVGYGHVCFGAILQDSGCGDIQQE